MDSFTDADVNRHDLKLTFFMTLGFASSLLTYSAGSDSNFAPSPVQIFLIGREVSFNAGPIEW